MRRQHVLGLYPFHVLLNFANIDLTIRAVIGKQPHSRRITQSSRQPFHECVPVADSGQDIYPFALDILKRLNQLPRNDILVEASDFTQRQIGIIGFKPFVHDRPTVPGGFAVQHRAVGALDNRNRLAQTAQRKQRFAPKIALGIEQ